MTTPALSQRARYLKRREARAARTPKGPPGYTPRGYTREDRALDRIVRRKLRQGRPGRQSNAPRSTFDWEKVVRASDRPEFRLRDRRRKRGREWPR